MISFENIPKFNIALDTLNFLSGTPLDEKITFDTLVSAVVGSDDEVSFDDIGTSESVITSIVSTLDSIGCSENVINSILDEDDEVSQKAMLSVASSIQSQFDETDMLESAIHFSNFANLDEIEIEDEDECSENDAAMPNRKAGYKRTMVVRGGKKVWINKRNPNKKVRLSIKQKLGLAKARRKSNTGLAKMKRAKSNRARAKFNLGK